MFRPPEVYLDPQGYLITTEICIPTDFNQYFSLQILRGWKDFPTFIPRVCIQHACKDLHQTVCHSVLLTHAAVVFKRQDHWIPVRVGGVWLWVALKYWYLLTLEQLAHAQLLTTINPKFELTGK